MMASKTLRAATRIAGSRNFVVAGRPALAPALGLLSGRPTTKPSVQYRQLWSPTFPAIQARSFPTPAVTATTVASTGATRQLSTAVAAEATSASSAAASSSNNGRRNLLLGLAGSVVLAGLHSATGSQTDFYEYRFTTHKSPDDLATFYGGEEFMELFSVFPLVGHLMMRNGSFDETGNYYVTGLPGTLKVSMVFSDETNEETEQIQWFNKRERFRDTCFGWTCWDMVTNFGFRTLEDGTVEVYHYGEYFHGNLPLVSQLALLVFKVHARWVAWATEHHLNHYAFTAETEEEEEMEEESRKNMPFFLLRHYAWSDLMAMLFGTKDDVEEDKSSFLVRRPSAVDKEEDRLLPIQRDATKIQISQDIASDRMATKGMLARSATSTADDVKALLTRNYTIKESSDGSSSSINSNNQGNAYSVATEAARLRHLTRRESLRQMSRRETSVGADNNDKESEKPVDSGAATTQKSTTKPGQQSAPALRRQPSSLGA